MYPICIISKCAFVMDTTFRNKQFTQGDENLRREKKVGTRETITHKTLESIISRKIIPKMFRGHLREGSENLRENLSTTTII